MLFNSSTNNTILIFKKPRTGPSVLFPKFVFFPFPSEFQRVLDTRYSFNHLKVNRSSVTTWVGPDLLSVVLMRLVIAGLCC